MVMTWGMVQMFFFFTQMMVDTVDGCEILHQVSTILLVVQDFAGPSTVDHDISHMQPMVLEYESQHVPHK